MPIGQKIIAVWQPPEPIDGPGPCVSGPLDLLMTEVPDLIQVAVVGPIHNSKINYLFLQSFYGTGFYKLVC